MAVITLGGVALGVMAHPVQDYLQSKWQTERDHADRRWRLEWDSLVELQALVEGFAIRDDSDRTLERDKVHAAGLGARVSDNRVRLAVDPLLATRVGSQDMARRCFDRD